ncbi:MAG: pur operon repressor [Christensenellales bacterium]|jgi:purine operon repressor
MEKVKRNERIAVMTRVLTENPNKLFTLTHFSKLFSAAKSTISEDFVIIRNAFEDFHLGEIETITGASGGVKYHPSSNRERDIAFIESICAELNDPQRTLPGGFLYMSDILSNPAKVQYMGEMLAKRFTPASPDFVLTIETRGIPVALMTARVLGLPLVIARRDNRMLEGSLVTINYLSGSGRMETMSLARRAVKEGQRALVIDDFMRAGGSAKGLSDMMREFNVNIAGIGMVMAMTMPARKLVEDYTALMVASDTGEGTLRVQPAGWLQKE